MRQGNIQLKTYGMFQSVANESVRVKPGSPSTSDIIAYFTGAFIVTSFIVAVCIPTEKCKPSYEFEQASGLRIPLEIYELYGQHYRPSARRKLKTAIARATDSIPNDFQYESHFQNVAVVSNSKNDLSWHWLSSASVTTESRGEKAANLDLEEEPQDSTKGKKLNKVDFYHNQQLLISPSRFKKANHLHMYVDEDERNEKSSIKHFPFDELYVFSVGKTEQFSGEFKAALSGSCLENSYIEEASCVSGNVPLKYKVGCREVFPRVGEGQWDITSVKCIESDIQVMANSGPRRFSLC